MALADAVILVAEQMEEEAKDLEGAGDAAGTSYARMTLKGFARQLRTAVKSAEGQQQAQPRQMSAGEYEAKLMEAARQEAREAKRHARMAEEVTSNSVLCVGGPMDETYVPMESGMPVGARTRVGGAVYRLKEDGCLHLDEVAIPMAKLELGKA